MSETAVSTDINNSELISYLHSLEVVPWSDLSIVDQNLIQDIPNRVYQLYQQNRDTNDNQVIWEEGLPADISEMEELWIKFNHGIIKNTILSYHLALNLPIEFADDMLINQFEDLLSTAYLSIFNAFQTFNPVKGEFKTYAISIIRYDQLKFVKSNSRLPLTTSFDEPVGQNNNRDLYELRLNDNNVDIIQYLQTSHISQIIEDLLDDVDKFIFYSFLGLNGYDEISMTQIGSYLDPSQNQAANNERGITKQAVHLRYKSIIARIRALILEEDDIKIMERNQKLAHKNKGKK